MDLSEKSTIKKIIHYEIQTINTLKFEYNVSIFLKLQ